MFAIKGLILIKILAIAFTALGVFLLSRKIKSVYFLWLVGATSALAYFFLVNNQPLLLWGLQGDELTIAAMYSSFAHVSFWSDYAFHGLPPFYPPAFFWLFASIGRFFDWNGVQMAKLAAFSFFLFFSAITYYLSLFFWKREDCENNNVGRMTVFLAPLVIVTILDKDLLIGKPYEVLAGMMTIYWLISVYFAVLKDEWNWRQTFFYGVTAGLIFMIYYLWLVFAAIVFALLGMEIERGREWRYYKRLLPIVPVAIVTSLPYLGPLIFAYAKNGTENWQAAFFTPNGLDLWLPMFSVFTSKNLILLGGLFVLIYYRRNNFVKPLLYFFLAAFAWWVMGLVTLFFGAPFQEFRGFYILAPIALAVAAAFGIDRLWHEFEIEKKENWRYSLSVIGVLFFASQSVFGFFVDDYRIRNEKTPVPDISMEMLALTNWLKGDSDSSKLTLHTVPQVSAFEPLNSAIYFNQHNTHPAANFSARYYYIKSMAAARTSDELKKMAENYPFGRIERFIFFGDRDYYYLYFHLDKMVDGIVEEQIKFPKKLFSEKYFRELFSVGGYDVLELK